MMVTTLEADPFVGRVAIGRIIRGKAKTNQSVAIINGDQTTKARIGKVFIYQGLQRVETPEAGMGEIVALTGLGDVSIGYTVADAENPEALPMVNHKDFDKTNNDVDNLEYCTARYNVIYSAIAKKTSSEYLGVTWNKSVRKWQAQYQIGKKKIYIGCFDTQEEAHEAYVNAIKEI